LAALFPFDSRVVAGIYFALKCIAPATMAGTAYAIESKVHARMQLIQKWLVGTSRREIIGGSAAHWPVASFPPIEKAALMAAFLVYSITPVYQVSPEDSANFLLSYRGVSRDLSAPVTLVESCGG
jgi:hypothetical protein